MRSQSNFLACTIPAAMIPLKDKKDLPSTNSNLVPSLLPPSPSKPYGFSLTSSPSFNSLSIITNKLPNPSPTPSKPSSTSLYYSPCNSPGWPFPLLSALEEYHTSSPSYNVSIFFRTPCEVLKNENQLGYLTIQDENFSVSTGSQIIEFSFPRDKILLGVAKERSYECNTPFQIILESQVHGSIKLKITQVIPLIDTLHKLSQKIHHQNRRKEHHSALIIQRRWKTYCLRKEYQTLKRATILLQSYIRRYLTWKTSPWRYRFRHQILDEFRSTEHFYIEKLDALLHQTCFSLIFPSAHGTLQLIWDWHVEFQSHWNEDQLGNVFLTKVSGLIVYQGYAEAYEHVVEELDKEKIQKKVDPLIKELKSNDVFQKLDLLSLLILPVQRIPRYELLFKSVLRSTPLTHPDYKSLQQAIVQLHFIATHLNRIRISNEHRHQLRTILTFLPPPPSSSSSSLMNSSSSYMYPRFFLAQIGSVLYFPPHELKSYEVDLYLFSDVLIAFPCPFFFKLSNSIQKGHIRRWTSTWSPLQPRSKKPNLIIEFDPFCQLIQDTSTCTFMFLSSHPTTSSSSSSSSPLSPSSTSTSSVSIFSSSSSSSSTSSSSSYTLHRFQFPNPYIFMEWQNHFKHHTLHSPGTTLMHTSLSLDPNLDASTSFRNENGSWMNKKDSKEETSRLKKKKSWINLLSLFHDIQK